MKLSLSTKGKYRYHLGKKGEKGRACGINAEMQNFYGSSGGGWKKGKRGTTNMRNIGKKDRIREEGKSKKVRRPSPS